MGLAIPIETSARHIHLCRESLEVFFKKRGSISVNLGQPGQLPEAPGGPQTEGDSRGVQLLNLRGETEVEISMTDSEKTGNSR